MPHGLGGTMSIDSSQAGAGEFYDPELSSSYVREDSTNQQYAPRYSISDREIGAVEIPAIVDNVDRALLAFGRVPDLQHALDPMRNSLPLYLNPESPFCRPLMSHNARSHNVVLKVTVPKRTGRKRKRGSNGSWLVDEHVTDQQSSDNGAQVCSTARLDDPATLRRKLQDNVDRYHVEAVGTIKHTHRFRGFGDFYWDMSRSDFAQRYVDQVLPGDIEKMKDFRFQEGQDQGPQVDILPPPIFTHLSLPFNYQYSQNPYVRTTEDGDTINVTAVKLVGHFVGADEPAPAGPQIQPNMNNPHTAEIIAGMKELFKQRPMWTRRALMNRMAGVIKTWNELKRHLNYVAYQFKGGPWRDAVIPYGSDPRTDARYRNYQTLMFKLQRRSDKLARQSWHAARREEHRSQADAVGEKPYSHIFDGETYSGDGKIWQVCDITDPLLRRLLDGSEPRETWDPVSGWYHGGLWAKVKGIMKTKLVAIRFSRKLQDSDFIATMNVGDASPVRNPSNAHGWHLPLPNLNLTRSELEQMGKTFSEGRRNRYAGGYVTKQRDILKGQPSGSQPETDFAQEEQNVLEDMEFGNEENDGSDEEDEADMEDHDDD